MLQFQVIGNLGADARVEEANGRKFVSFNVGHNERWTDDRGNAHESTSWISCALNGDGGNLLPHLVKGRQVYVSGRGSVRVYSSPKTHRMEAGINISVERIELIGSQQNEVPSRLVDFEGVLHTINKAYWIPFEEAVALGAKDNSPANLWTPSGERYNVSIQGWITKAPKPAADVHA